MVNHMSLLTDKIRNIKPSVIKVISIINRNPDGSVKAYAGSGFIVDETGHILTNDHVIKNPNPRDNIIQFYDGVRIPVNSIISRNTKLDYAILKIDSPPIYQFLELGEYHDVNEGDDIFFCGYPFGGDNHTSHKGMVSSKFSENGIDIIQLDASINVGNSGGPLICIRNDLVVGIITSKLGGVGEQLENLSDFLKRVKSPYSVNWTLPNGQRIRVDPLKTTAELIDLLNRYSNVGIGHAFSVNYGKRELKQRDII